MLASANETSVSFLIMEASSIFFGAITVGSANWGYEPSFYLSFSVQNVYDDFCLPNLRDLSVGIVVGLATVTGPSFSSSSSESEGSYSIRSFSWNI